MDNTIFRLEDLMSYTGLSRSVIYDRMNKRSTRYDPTFPPKFTLGGGAVGWFKKDVDAWLLRCSRTGKQSQLDSHASASSPPDTTSTLQKSVNKPKLTQATASASPASKSSLGQYILAGERLNETMREYLFMPKWTPVQAALLIYGIIPPAECSEIPSSGIGLENKPLKGGERIANATKFLEVWRDCEISGSEFSPAYFFEWCFDERINSEWLALFLELAGCENTESSTIASSRLALQFSK